MNFKNIIGKNVLHTERQLKDFQRNKKYKIIGIQKDFKNGFYSILIKYKKIK